MSSPLLVPCMSLRSHTSPGEGLQPGISRGFTSQRPGLAPPAPLVAGRKVAVRPLRLPRAPCWPMPGDESFAPTRSIRALHVAQSLRWRPECQHRQGLRGRPKPPCHPTDSAARASLSRKSIKPAIPPIDPLTQAARWVRRSEEPTGPYGFRRVVLAHSARPVWLGRRLRLLTQPCVWG